MTLICVSGSRWDVAIATPLSPLLLQSENPPRIAYLIPLSITLTRCDTCLFYDVVEKWDPLHLPQILSSQGSP